MVHQARRELARDPPIPPPLFDRDTLKDKSLGNGEEAHPVCAPPKCIHFVPEHLDSASWHSEAFVHDRAQFSDVEIWGNWKAPADELVAAIEMRNDRDQIEANRLYEVHVARRR